MSARFSEEQVHQYIYQQGLERLVDDVPEFDQQEVTGSIPQTPVEADGEFDFELWRIIKAKAMKKLEGLHRTIRYGDFVGSGVKLPIDGTRPMQLDLLGQHEDGIFILELKVDRSAERNAFSELFAYSNYIAEMFALSGCRDITNVLVANLDVKITKQAFLYDLLITDRNIIVYKPEFSGDAIDSLRLKLHVPSDDDFRYFTNKLLSHDAMACVVVSFHDIPGWIDSSEIDGSLPAHTVGHLKGLSSYAAQLMEAEGMHGFCFIRKPWLEIPRYYRNSFIICALNPFKIGDPDRVNTIVAQLDISYRSSFIEIPEIAFDGRLLSIADDAIKDCLTHDHACELETPIWSSMVVSGPEVVYTHNFGFRPTGMMREAYVSFLNEIYARNEQVNGYTEDVSTLKVNEISNWLRAWQFMEMCGFTEGGNDEEELYTGNDDTECA